MNSFANPPANTWDPPTDPASDAECVDGIWTGWLSELTKEFDVGATDLKTELDAALQALKANSSNASLLADYQAKLSEYTLYRGAQSKTIEALANMDKATVNRLA